MIVVNSVVRICLKIASILLFLITILAGYGGYVNPSLSAFPSMALLVFPYLAIATLIVSVIWIATRHFIFGCVGVASILLCAGPFSTVVPFHFSEKPQEGEKTFKLLTFNSLHLKDIRADKRTGDTDVNRALSYLINSGADVICLQELFSFHRQVRGQARGEMQLDSLFSIYPFIGGDEASDLKVLSKYPIKPLGYKLDVSSSFAAAGFYLISLPGGFRMTLVNVHLTSYLLTEKERHILTSIKSKEGAKESVGEFKGSVYGKLKKAFVERGKVAENLVQILANVDGPAVVCGDFNDVPSSWAYRRFTEEGFHDAYAAVGFGPLHTFNKYLFYFHIDQILYRGALKPLCVERGPLDTSDHYPLIAEFAYAVPDRLPVAPDRLEK